jgi:hypothetical protein
MDDLRQVRSSGRRTPDFFIVGHAKCGTTAMHTMLRAHPQIYMPALKETQFLAHDPSERVWPSRRPAARPQTLDAYLSLWQAARAGQLVGEASTAYLRTPGAAARIAALDPDARIVAIFREPVDFLRSFHLQLLQVNIETEPDFQRAIGLEHERARDALAPRDALRRRALMYSEHVRYVEQLRRFHEAFGRERVLALIYDDFRQDNERVLLEVLRFLGVEGSRETPGSFEIQRAEANPTVRVRSHQANDMVDAITMGRGPLSSAAKATLKTVVPRAVRRRALRAVRAKIIDREPPVPDEAFMAELRHRFKGEVVAASEYLQRDLVELWGYRDVP